MLASHLAMSIPSIWWLALGAWAVIVVGATLACWLLTVLRKHGRVSDDPQEEGLDGVGNWHRI